MSGFLEWNQATYGVDVPEMDHEHQVLIAHMNRLRELHDAKAIQPVLASALDTLLRYTARHFAHEEAHMESIGYAGLKSHARLHLELLKNAARHAAVFRSTGTLTDEFFHFLTFWLKAHIRGVDSKYARAAAAA